MDRELFGRRLVECATRTVAFSRTFLEESLPDALRFRVRVVSEGGSLQEDGLLSRGTAEEVVALLWRDGAVPEWVDLQVSGVDDEATRVEAVCSSRFTTNDASLDEDGGRHPFRVLGPALPADYEEGTPFSIRHTSTCATKDELAALVPHASKVQILRLVGGDFGDAALAALPCFPKVTSLLLRDSPVRGLAFLTGFPRIHHVSVVLVGQAFTAADMPAMPHLESLDVSGLPARDWDLAAMGTRLTRLALTSAHPMYLDGRWPEALADLSLSAPHAEGRLPTSLEVLHVHSSEADEEELERLLAGTTSVKRLNVRNTAASRASLERVVARMSIEVLEVGRAVSEETVERLKAASPGTRVRRAP